MVRAPAPNFTLESFTKVTCHMHNNKSKDHILSLSYIAWKLSKNDICELSYGHISHHRLNWLAFLQNRHGWSTSMTTRSRYNIEVQLRPRVWRDIEADVYLAHFYFECNTIMAQWRRACKVWYYFWPNEIFEKFDKFIFFCLHCTKRWSNIFGTIIFSHFRAKMKPNQNLYQLIKTITNTISQHVINYNSKL
jgi:hypothetical protein